MSLLEGPHTVTVFPVSVLGKTKYGTHKTIRGAGIIVESVTVAPFGSGSFSNLEAEDEASVNDTFTVKGTGVWPGGVKSIILFNGKEYDQEGIPKVYDRGVRTKHYVVRMKARGAEVK